MTRRLPISVNRFRSILAYPSATVKSSIPSNHRFSTLALTRKPHQLLSSTPCHLAYIKPCRCCQLQPYIHLNPGDPNNEKVKGSLDPILEPDANKLEDDDLEIGEVRISSDGMVHPETAFPQPLGPGQYPIRYPSHLIRFIQICSKTDFYLTSLACGGDWCFYQDFGDAAEQFHMWLIPGDSPLPDNLHLYLEPGSQESKYLPAFYNLQISKAMTLPALNAKLNGFLEKYARVCPLNKFDKKRRFGGERK